MDLKLICVKSKLANELFQRNYKEHSDKAKSSNVSFSRCGNTTTQQNLLRTGCLEYTTNGFDK